VRSVVVHRGARDHYQLARALHESGALETLVTDLYWPGGTWWARMAGRVLPTSARRKLAARSEPALDDRRVRTCGVSGAISHAASLVSSLPFPLRQRLVRWTDHALGREARRVATRRGAAIVSYSYYAYSAFLDAPAHLPRILFQVHPHPASVRAILRHELEAHPDCSASLLKEWELSLSDDEYLRLVHETRSAQAWIAASSFTKQTMVEQGIPAEKIAVAPYGVDLEWFSPTSGAGAGDERNESRARRDQVRRKPLHALFVGTITQRKGIRYLVDALERLGPSHVHLTVCGRVVDDLSVLRTSKATIAIRPNVSAEELRAQYRAADVFVLPSLAEGFGHVLLESLACGTPVITTTRSAGPDLIRDGQEGFVIPPADSLALVDTLQWCLDHRADLSAMRELARARAETFTWAAFRSRVANVIDGYVGQHACLAS
jgi:glycosyltransferase involved in cell wall biosynthesis